MVLADGTLAILPSRSIKLTLWSTSPESLRFLKDVDGDVISCFIQLANGNLATGSREETVKIVNPKTGECIRTLKGHENKIYQIVQLSDGNIASSETPAGKVIVWNPETGEAIHTLQQCSKGRTSCLAQLKDGTFATAASQECQIWDLKTGKEIRKIDLPSPVCCLIALADGNFATDAGDDFKIWDPKTGEEVRTFERAHDDSIKFAKQLPDGLVVTTSDDCDSIRLWDPNTGRNVHEVDRVKLGMRERKLAPCVAQFPDGTLVTASNTNTADNEEFKVLLWKKKTGEDPKKKIAEAAAALKTVGPWKLSTQIPLQGIPLHDAAYDVPLVALVQLADGRLATGCAVEAFRGMNEIKIWDPKSKDCIRTLESQKRSTASRRSSYRFVTALPDGNLVCALEEAAPIVWNPTTGERVRVLDNTRPPGCVALFPEGIATGHDCCLKIWDSAGEEILTIKSKKGQSGWGGAAFNSVDHILPLPDGKLLTVDSTVSGKIFI